MREMCKSIPQFVHLLKTLPAYNLDHFVHIYAAWLLSITGVCLMFSGVSYYV